MIADTPSNKLYMFGERVFQSLKVVVTTAYAQSLSVDDTADNIGWAVLSATADPGDGSVIYYLSNTGAANFSQVIAGSVFDFSTAGSDLRFLVELRGSAVVNDISIQYGGYHAVASLGGMKFDGEAVTDWGTLSWNADLNGQGVQVYSRSAETEGALASTAWSDAYVSGSAIASPRARWLELKAEMQSDGIRTPALHDISFNYVTNAPAEMRGDATHTNVVALQGSGGLVTALFEVRDLDTNAGTFNPGQVDIALEYWDAGQWNLASGTTGTGLITLNTPDPLQYTAVTVGWDPHADLDNRYMTDARVRIVADDREGANNTATLESEPFLLDTKDPVVTEVKIFADASELLTVATDDVGLQIKISNNESLGYDGINADSGTWVAYDPVVTLRSWDYGIAPAIRIWYQLKDGYGNTTPVLTASVPDAPQNLVAYDISNPQTTDWRTFVTWTPVSEPSDGFRYHIVYRSTDQQNWENLTPGGITDRQVNYVKDSGLDSATRYYYRVTTEDMAGKVSRSSAYGNTIPDGSGGWDIVKPVITNLRILDVGYDSAVIVWDTDEISDSAVYYGTGSYSKVATVPTMLVASHSVILIGLEDQTTYTFKMVSRDPFDNVGTNDNDGQGYTFTTTEAPPVPTPTAGGVSTVVVTKNEELPAAPKISNLTVTNITTTGATVMWNTDTNASSFVKYGITGSYGLGVFGDYALLKNHSVTMNGLTPATLYHIAASSADTYGQTTVSPDKTFTTGALAEDAPIAPVVTETVTQSSPTIFIPDEGPAVVTETTTTREVAITAETVLSSLEKLIEQEGESIIPELQETFNAVSLQITPPRLLFEPPKVNVEGNSAVISWQTNRPANSIVVYVPDHNFVPTSRDPYTKLTGDPIETTLEHAVKIEDLIPGTQYHYKVRSKSFLGGWVESKDDVFNTATELPVIESPVVKRISDTQAEVSWKTNIPSDSQVKYTPKIDNVFDPANTKIEGATELVLDHSLLLPQLKPGNSYQFEVESKDAFNNGISLVLPDIFVTGDDKVAPIVLQIKTEGAVLPGKGENKSQIIVSWSTDEPATGKVYWQEGVGLEGVPAKESAVYKELTNTHSILLPDLKPGTTYQLKVESTDEFANTIISQNFLARTPQKEETIIDIILGAFEGTFEWLKNLRI